LPSSTVVGSDSGDLKAKESAWSEALAEANLALDVATCGSVLDVLDERREAVAAEAGFKRRIESIERDERDHRPV
jgi:hypothetical protein